MKNNYHLIFGCILVFLLALGQLQRIELRPGIVIYLHDIFLAGWLSYFLLSKHHKLGIKKHWPKLTIVWLAWLLFSLIVNSIFKFQLTPFLYLFRLGLYTSGSWMISQIFTKKQIQLGLLTLGLLYAWFGLLQYLLLPDTRFLAIWGWDDHYYRLISTLLDPAFVGIILVISWLEIPIVLAEHKLVSKLIMFSLLTAIVLTFSRSTYLALVVALLVRNWQVKKIKYVLASLCWLALFGCLVWLAPKPAGEGVNLQRTASITARQQAAKDTTSKLTLKDLVIGQGIFSPIQPETISWSVMQQTNHARIADNWLIFFLQGSGVIGLILILSVIANLVWQLWKQQSEVLASLLALLAHSLFNASLVQPFVFLFLMILLMGTTTKSSK